MLYVFPTVHGPFVEDNYTRRRRCDLIFCWPFKLGRKDERCTLLVEESGISFGIHLKFGIRTWWAGPVAIHTSSDCSAVKDDESAIVLWVRHYLSVNVPLPSSGAVGIFEGTEDMFHKQEGYYWNGLALSTYENYNKRFAIGAVYSSTRQSQRFTDMPRHGLSDGQFCR